MTQITLPVHVMNGHIQHEQILAELEGQQFIATLTAVPRHSSNGNNGDSKPLEISADADSDSVPPPWLDVEEDLYFPMTVKEILLEKKPLIVERGTPSILLPEDLPDD